MRKSSFFPREQNSFFFFFCKGNFNEHESILLLNGEKTLYDENFTWIEWRRKRWKKIMKIMTLVPCFLLHTHATYTISYIFYKISTLLHFTTLECWRRRCEMQNGRIYTYHIFSLPSNNISLILFKRYFFVVQVERAKKKWKFIHLSSWELFSSNFWNAYHKSRFSSLSKLWRKKKFCVERNKWKKNQYEMFLAQSFLQPMPVDTLKNR